MPIETKPCIRLSTLVEWNGTSLPPFFFLLFFFPLRPLFCSENRNGNRQIEVIVCLHDVTAAMWTMKYSFGDLTLFLCKSLLLFHCANMASGHMSAHTLLSTKPQLFKGWLFLSCGWIYIRYKYTYKAYWVIMQMVIYPPFEQMGTRLQTRGKKT